jgi:hypothetical protein
MLLAHVLFAKMRNAHFHPDTRKPYSWHGGDPSFVKHEDLPSISEAEARALVDDAVVLLVEQHGYKVAGATRSKANGHAEDAGGHADWASLLANIHGGHELHDSICTLAAKLITAGMGDAAAINFLRGAMDSTTTPHDARWRERYDEIPRAVASAREKFGNANAADVRSERAVPVDLWAAFDPPDLPEGTLPQPIEKWARAESAP